MARVKGGLGAKKRHNRTLKLAKGYRGARSKQFYMGTDFRKLKAPAMWYDIVGVVDVLSHLDCIKDDERFTQMVMIIKSKQDENGLFTSEATYQKFKGWDFGQKKQPSP